MTRSQYWVFSEGGTHEKTLCPQDQDLGSKVSKVNKGVLHTAD